MPEDVYPYRVEPDTGFADGLEDELLRRLHGTVDNGTVTEPDAADRAVAVIDQDAGDRRLRRSGTARRKRRWMSLGTAAAVAAVLALVGVAFWWIPSEQNAAAAVRHAIERQETIDSYEGTFATEYPDGSSEGGNVRVDGDDAELDFALEHADGRTESFTFTAVGELVYTRFNGENVVSPRQPGDSLQPSLSDLSRALRGVLDNSDVTRAGSEVIAGTEASRYDVELNERSRAALADPVLGFEPGRVATLTIWVADDFPRQLEWTLDDGEHTIFTMLSIGEDFAITAPEGDYTFDPKPDFFDL